MRNTSGTVPPYLDFSRNPSPGTDYDARFVLDSNDELKLQGADLHINNGNLWVNGYDKGILIGGTGGMPFLKMPGTLNPLLQLLTNQPNRRNTMILNNWWAQSNPGVTVGTTRPDGVAFNVVSNVALTNGLPTSDGDILMTVLGTGEVGIGTTVTSAKLTVKGDVHAREVRVTATAGADFVFEEEYKLPKLEDVDKFIKEHKHLPEIAPASEMQSKGVDLGDMNMKLLQKVEELTLYMIELKSEVNELKKKNNELVETVKQLKN